jgi:hypothetical protein
MSPNMSDISILLFLLSIVALPIGLIKPKWILRRDGVSRKQFGLWGVLAVIVSLIMVGSTAPTPTPAPSVQGATIEASLTPASETIQEASPSPLPSPAEVVSPKPSPTLAPTSKPSPVKTATPTPSSNSGLSNDNTYTNSAGSTVHSPAYTNDGGVPAGASAQCGDGTYSFSQSRRGTCSHHGGVAKWL